MISSDIAKRAAKITGESLKLYLDFWGNDRFLISDNGELSVLIRKAIPSEMLCEIGCADSKALAVTEAGSTSSVSAAQFLYDIEVFYGIYSEIKDRITFERFCVFFKDISTKCRAAGWSILFSVKNRITEKLEASGIDAEVISGNGCPSKAILIVNGSGGFTAEFYDRHKDICRIAKHFFLELLREWIITETCVFFKKRLAENGVSLYLCNWEWAQNNILYPKTSPTSAEIDARKKISIYNIAGDEANHSDFLRQLYGDCSEEYIRDIFDIPPKLDISKGKVRHSDKVSRYLNVVSGERHTMYGKPSYDNTVYLLGGCVFFGYAIDDGNTIASHLQKLLSENCAEKSWRVCNYATWGGNIDQTYAALFDIDFKPGDIVLISYAGLLPVGDFDISDDMTAAYKGKEFYYDGIFHCVSEGYHCVARNIYSLLKDEFSKITPDGAHFTLENAEKSESDARLGQYISETRTAVLTKHSLSGKTGAIVMNCNPFTLGHRYLIEYASSRVDTLIIFVVEEDRSFFPFNDRIKLVRAGTADLPNVAVVPSGAFIISTVTFPGYFMKDNPEKVVLDSSQDVEMFAEKIAPAFGISVRFVGEEPLDIVTNQYNETLKSILPRHGIELVEIPRKENGDKVISASRVRALLKENDLERISKLVPPTTLEYLKGFKLK